MDRDQIRKALDHFENDEYVDAKEIIAKEISGTRDVFLKDKLGLTNDINITEPVTDDKGSESDGDDE